MLLSKKPSQRILRGFLFLIIFLFCVNIFSESWQDSTVSFRNIENVRPQWQSFADGIGYIHGKTTFPQLEFWVLMIDLEAPNTRIITSAGNSLYGSTLSMRVSSFVRSNNLAAGINAVPFDIVSSLENQPIKNLGVVISDGNVLSGINPHYDAVVFYKDGTAAICRQADIPLNGSIENAIGGFHQILAGGEPAQRTLSLNDRHPRSAAGVSTNGRYLYLLVIDGRRSDSAGTTEKETALLLANLGSSSGINFDGGGSSALALRYSDGSVKTANIPVHNGIPGRERAVAGCLGVAVLN
jgi:exopolysaccharide biosynthesis protein